MDAENQPQQFRPARGLANPHIQTVLPTYFMKRQSFPGRIERFELPCGDYIDGVWTDKPDDGPTVVLLHGLGGSAKSHYITSLMNFIHYQTNWNALAINFRGCGEDMQRHFQQYHGGDTEDIKFILKLIKQRNPNEPTAMVGFSLGGNVLLKLFGELKYHNLCETGVAISPPFDIEATAEKVHKGINSLYEKVFVNDLKQTLLSKYPQNMLPDNFQEKLNNISSLKALDEQFTAPQNGYGSSSEYYKDVSSKYYLHNIQKPTLIVIAKDDPIINYDNLPQALFDSGFLQLECYDNGGHIGFVKGSILSPSCWINERIMRHLVDYLPLGIHS